MELTTECSLFDRQRRNETIDVRENEILSNQREDVPRSYDHCWVLRGSIRHDETYHSWRDDFAREIQRTSNGVQIYINQSVTLTLHNTCMQQVLMLYAIISHIAGCQVQTVVKPGVKVSRNATERCSGARKFKLGAFRLQNYLISQPQHTFLGPAS